MGRRKIKNPQLRHETMNGFSCSAYNQEWVEKYAELTLQDKSKVIDQAISYYRMNTDPEGDLLLEIDLLYKQAKKLEEGLEFAREMKARSEALARKEISVWLDAFMPGLLRGGSRDRFESEKRKFLKKFCPSVGITEKRARELIDEIQKVKVEDNGRRV